MPISKEPTLISRYRSSNMKDASCRPYQSLTKMFSSIICFGSVLVDLITNGGAESNFKSQVGPKLT